MSRSLRPSNRGGEPQGRISGRPVRLSGHGLASNRAQIAAADLPFVKRSVGRRKRLPHLRWEADQSACPTWDTH
jgi:hypothetical protein